MKKKMLIFTLMLLTLFTVSCVCASDTNDTAVASDDATPVELSQSEDISEISAADDNNVIEQESDEEITETSVTDDNKVI